jgi:hypothetical protein
MFEQIPGILYVCYGYAIPLVIYLALYGLRWNEGLWGNFLALGCVMFSILIAVGWWEDLAQLFALKLPSWMFYMDCFAIWLIFIVSLFILDSITRSLSRVSVFYGEQIEKIGNGVVLFLLGTTIYIFFLFTENLSPVGDLLPEKTTFPGLPNVMGNKLNNGAEKVPDSIANALKQQDDKGQEKPLSIGGKAFKDLKQDEIDKIETAIKSHKVSLKESGPLFSGVSERPDIPANDLIVIPILRILSIGNLASFTNPVQFDAMGEFRQDQMMRRTVIMNYARQKDPKYPTTLPAQQRKEIYVTQPPVGAASKSAETKNADKTPEDTPPNQDKQ